MGTDMSCHQDTLSAHSPLLFSELRPGTKNRILGAKLVVLVANCTPQGTDPVSLW